jgi:hypothetical protein
MGKKSNEMMHIVNLRKLREYYSEQLPDAVRKFPGLIHKNERLLLYGLAKNYYRGCGIIVDAGTLVGASTACFGQGIIDNPEVNNTRNRKLIHAYERGIVNKTMPYFFQRKGITGDFPVGSSFEHILKELTKPWQHMINYHVGDICSEQPLNEEVEILFLDVLKSPDINWYCTRTFFPLLRPGSIIIQQDYFQDRLPWIQVSMEHFTPYMEFAGEVQCTAVFILKDPIPKEALIDPWEDLSKDDQYRLHRQARSRTTDRARQLLVGMSYVNLINRHDGSDVAVAELDSLLAKYEDVLQENPGSRRYPMQARVEDIRKKITQGNS